MASRVWRAEKVPNDPQNRWIVVSDDGLAVGGWSPTQENAETRAEWQNQKEAVFEVIRIGLGQEVPNE